MRIGYGISVAGSNQRNLVSAQAEQVIWKVAIFGAGTTSSNGEYVWDGETFSLDKPLYISGLNSISWTGSYWTLADDTTLGGDEAYSSSDLISWSESNGDLPAPSSALSYAQDSFIISVTVSGAGEPTSDGTYTRTNGGQAPFSRSSDSIDFDAGTWKIGDLTFGDYTYESIDLMSWSQLTGQLPTPDTSAIVYSA